MPRRRRSRLPATTPSWLGRNDLTGKPRATTERSISYESAASTTRAAGSTRSFRSTSSAICPTTVLERQARPAALPAQPHPVRRGAAGWIMGCRHMVEGGHPQRPGARSRRRRPCRRRRGYPLLLRHLRPRRRSCRSAPHSRRRAFCARWSGCSSRAGRFVFAGEPTTVGNTYARTLANLTWNVTIRDEELFRAEAAGGARRRSSTKNSLAAALSGFVDFWHLRIERAGEDDQRRRRRVGTLTEEFTAASAAAVRPSSRLCCSASWAGAGPSFGFGSWTTSSWFDANVWRRASAQWLLQHAMRVTGVKPS